MQRDNFDPFNIPEDDMNFYQPQEDLDLYARNNERENNEDFIRSQEENGW